VAKNVGRMPEFAFIAIATNLESTSLNVMAANNNYNNANTLGNKKGRTT